MSDIRTARDVLLMALDCDDIEAIKYAIREACELMTREPPQRHPKRVSNQTIPEHIKAQVKQYAASHPDDTLTEIAVLFNIRSAGKVSRLLAGKE
jgi:hypothetical protein